MIPAAQPRYGRGEERLLVVDPARGCWGSARVMDLGQALDPGDLLVVNDAATLPASLAATTQEGQSVEVRLAEPPFGDSVRAVLLGEGDWRTPTEHRGSPPAVGPGEILSIGPDLVAQVVRAEGRVVRLRLLSSDVWGALYRHGRVVQYSYLHEEVALVDVQTAFAARPWSVEMPSAARPLTTAQLLTLRAQGVHIATLTHAAGLSSIDGVELDGTLPWPERSFIPQSTIDAIGAAKRSGHRVIAVGTTVTRALEGRVHALGELRAGESTTDLILGPDSELSVVDGLLSNLHSPGESHFELMTAFAPREVLVGAGAFAEERGFLAHEFGDATLILSASLARMGVVGCA